MPNPGPNPSPNSGLIPGSTPGQTAILFADVANSTALYERVGDTEALKRIGACLARQTLITKRAGGRVVKSIGDEIMCAFADASTALRAATDMQMVEDAIKGNGLALRIGFHVGEAIERDGDLFGDSVNVAARIAALAKPGQILTTGGAVQMLPEFMRAGLRRLGEVSVRGRQHALELFEAIWQWNGDLTMVDAAHLPGASAAPSPLRLQLRFRGRQFELAQGRDDAVPLTLGRGEENDIVVPIRQASRLHSRIEVRQSQFVLTDLSTNGTYIRSQSGDEMVLRREALPLHGNGAIALGHSTLGAPDDLIEYCCAAA